MFHSWKFSLNIVLRFFVSVAVSADINKKCYFRIFLFNISRNYLQVYSQLFSLVYPPIEPTLKTCALKHAHISIDQPSPSYLPQDSPLIGKMAVLPT